MSRLPPGEVETYRAMATDSRTHAAKEAFENVVAELLAVRDELVQAKAALEKSIADSKERSSKIRNVTAELDALLAAAKRARRWFADPENGAPAVDMRDFPDDTIVRTEAVVRQARAAEKAGAE